MDFSQKMEHKHTKTLQKFCLKLINLTIEEIQHIQDSQFAVKENEKGDSVWWYFNLPQEFCEARHHTSLTASA